MNAAYVTSAYVTPANVTSAYVTAAIIRAVAILGSEVKLAAACGVTQPAISKAKHKGRVSARLALRMHQATKGRVPASELRPDLWRWPEHVPPKEETSLD
jgi:DNA-binding transcriptional regulator YdaS (Cro superfamily)